MSLRRIDLNLLVVFEAVVAESNVSRAARRLHLSQSALSHALARLRDAFGDPVLVRRGRGMEPTPVALSALPEVQSILAQASRLFAHGGHFDPTRADRTVHIGVSDYAVMAVLPGVLAHIRTEAPSLRLHLHHCGRADAPAMLRSGQLELALGVFNTLTADLACLPLLEEPYLCAVAAGMRPPRTEREYLDADHLNVLVSGEALGLIDEALARRGLTRRIVLTVPHFSAALSLLASTPLVYTGPSGLIRRPGVAPKLKSADVPLELPPFRTQLGWSLRTQEDGALKWLRECFARELSRPGRQRAPNNLSRTANNIKL